MQQLFHIVGCLVEKDGKFLFIEESKPGREGLFGLPAGKIDNDESAALAAVRETYEESGYEVEVTGLVGFYQTITDSMNAGGLVFSGKIIGGAANPSDKHPSVNWYSPEQVRDLYAQNQLFTHYSLLAVEAYIRRGAYPLDVFSSIDYRSGNSSGS